MVRNKFIAFSWLFTAVALTSGCSSLKHNSSKEKGLQSATEMVGIAGTYSGFIPGPKGQEVMVSLNLTEAGNFMVTKQYLTSDGSQVSEFKGKALWRDSDHGLVISNPDESGFVFRWEDGKFYPLEVEGEPVTHEKAMTYSLVNENGFSGNSGTLVGYKWILTELDGKPVERATIPRQVISITFDGTERRISGSAGCNSYFGSYESSSGNRIYCSKINSTKMACSEEKMSTEQAFLKMLELIDRYLIKGEHLFLSNAEGDVVARFEKGRD